MTPRLRPLVLLAFLLLPLALCAQEAREPLPTRAALDRALRGSSSLTVGGSPFHALLKIAPEAGSSDDPGLAKYAGQIELYWKDATHYRLSVHAPDFAQDSVVDGAEPRATTTGAYYPKWLESFALALLNPLPPGDLRIGPALVVSTVGAQRCLRHDDTSHGVSDPMTSIGLCFTGEGARLVSVQTFDRYMWFTSWQPFNGKQIPRVFSLSMLDHRTVTGTLTLLEAWKPDDAVLRAHTASARPLGTTLVSPQQAEGLIERKPDVKWPAVRDGKTSGSVIVYARTDRSGQVRETAKYSSENRELEGFAVEQALHYKFRPLLVNGVPQQMETPLMLHFETRVDNPVPVLTAEQVKAQNISCPVKSLSPGALPKGTVVSVQLSVNENGSVREAEASKNMPKAWGPAVRSLIECRFPVYLVGGKPTPYKRGYDLVAP